jgi:hypothetical protein
LRPEFYFPSQMKEANIPAEKEEGLVKERWRDANRIAATGFARRTYRRPV